MNPLLYASLSKQTLSETIDGGSYRWPDFVAGGEVFFGLRFSQRRDGKDVLKDLDIVDIYGSAGRIDARPTTGETKLTFGLAERDDGVNTTAAIAPGISATDLQTAINAISDVGGGGVYPAAEVSEDFGTLVVVFPGHPDKVEIGRASCR